MDCPSVQQQQAGAVVAAALHPFAAALRELEKQAVRMMLLRTGTECKSQPSGHSWI